MTPANDELNNVSSDEAIVKRVPEVSRDMLDYFWEDLPLTLSKSTQRMIEAEKKKSMKILSELK